MSTRKILVTGGAGFIGSHLVDRLVKEGHQVTVLDALVPQVHETPPPYLNPKATLVRGDVSDEALLQKLLKDTDWVFHEAAAVGVGQSMYQITHYVQANTMATAHLLQVLSRREHGVKKLVVASSMSIYGEGLYECADHGRVHPPIRGNAQLEQRDWEQHCPHCDKQVKPLSTAEDKPLQSTSVYGISKKDQEEYCLVVGRAYGLPTVALRYFNVYGPRQALSNPYTGVCAIFSARLKNNHPPVVYEDGRQTRDFISVHDIVEANLLAAQKSAADYEAVNVGTGRGITILEIAQTLATLYRKKLEPSVENKFRPGDIRHCVADISKARRLLGFQPKVALEAGLKELTEWGAQQAAKDRFDQAVRELAVHGLVPQ